MAGEFEFTEGTLRVLTRRGFGWLVSEVRRAWLDAGLPSDPTEDQSLSSDQAAMLVEVLETSLMIELESLNQLGRLWDGVRFGGGRHVASDLEFSYDQRAIASSADALGMLRAVVHEFKSPLLEERE